MQVSNMGQSFILNLLPSKMRNIELAKSVEVKAPNLQKDVIMPQIYDLQNIKLIQSCYQEDTPRNNVTQIKKKNIEKVITSIINKKNPKSMKNQSGMWKSRGAPTLQQSTLTSNKSHSKLIESLTQEELFVDIDQQLGEMVMMNQQNFAPFAQRVKNILTKVKYQTVNKEKLQKEREVQEFILGIGGNPKKRLSSEAFKKVTGMIDSLHQIKLKQNSLKKVQRAQSAKLLRSKTDHSIKAPQTSSRLLSGYNRSCKNLKRENNLEDHLLRTQDIIKKVNKCLDDQSQKKKTSLNRMKSMCDQWSCKGQLHKTMATIGQQKWNNSTLQILKQRRMKSYALQRIDNQLFQN